MSQETASKGPLECILGSTHTSETPSRPQLVSRFGALVGRCDHQVDGCLRHLKTRRGPADVPSLGRAPSGYFPATLRSRSAPGGPRCRRLPVTRVVLAVDALDLIGVRTSDSAQRCLQPPPTYASPCPASSCARGRVHGGRRNGSAAGNPSLAFAEHVVAAGNPCPGP